MFEGFLDICSDDLIAGWVWDTDDREKRVEVDVIVDDGLLVRLRADQYRRDLEVAGIGNGGHGFSYKADPILGIGKRRIQVVISGTQFLLSRNGVESPQEEDGAQHPLALHQLAAKTWNRVEPLDVTNRRIHDGASDLGGRAEGYVTGLLFGNFPQAIPPAGADILEIGSGVGWIMEAMNAFLSRRDAAPHKIVGLDIAPNMLAKARERLGDVAPYAWQLYDGIDVPLPDCSFDLIYSVAALQHVPRPYAFNLFFEILRLLRPRGFATLHFPSTDYLRVQERLLPWRVEIANQIGGREAHWHHFYTAKELTDVLAITGFQHVDVRDDGRGTLAVSVSNSPA